MIELLRVAYHLNTTVPMSGLISNFTRQPAAASESLVIGVFRAVVHSFLLRGNGLQIFTVSYRSGRLELPLRGALICLDSFGFIFQNLEILAL
jgi:hypothetical protein